MLKFLEEVSTAPRRKSYCWRDEKISVLSFCLLWTVFACRVLSLLQWVKIIYRKCAVLYKRSTRDIGSKRINVPPIVVELYFISWFIIQLVIYLSHYQTAFSKGICYYFVFESVVWVVYYTILRRFFEESYSINHVLEYFVVLLILVPTQVLTFSNILGIPIKESFLGILGIETIPDHFVINLLGLGYQVIVIAMIISTFPSESVVVKETVMDHFIIGCGDVVINRLLPELNRRQEKVSYLYALSDSPDYIPACARFDTDSDLKNELLYHVDRNHIVWIATPSHTHAEYLRLLLNTEARFIVLEKPIAVSFNDLQIVKSEAIDKQDNQNRVFFLSYYILEKALPLYYYSLNNNESRRSNYKKYLKEYSVENVPPKEAIRKIEVVLEEGTDERQWVKNNGGQACETFIHNVLVASLFAGSPNTWTIIEKCVSNEGNNIELTAKKNNIDIHLTLKKNLNTQVKRRFAKLYFDNEVSLEADFDKESLCISNADRQKEYITMRRKYRRKYSVLTDLVYRYASGEFKSYEVDGRSNQIECLNWILTTFCDETSNDVICSSSSN